MTSQRRIEANRRNARKSTGPRSAEGKAIVAKNAVRHGLLSRDVLVRGEDEAEFNGFAEGLHAQLAPVGELEGLLVDRIIVNTWRLGRLARIEAAVLNEDHDRYEEFSRNIFSTTTQHKLAILSRYEAGLERGVYAAMRELERLQAARAQTLTALPLPESEPIETTDGDVE